MDARTPLVLEGIGLESFMRYILRTHAAPSTLIVCGTKEVFIQHLHEAVTARSAGSKDADDHGRPIQAQTWTTPTLRLLASSRTLKVVFCPELAHLRAYLAAYPYRTPRENDIDTFRPPSPRTSRLLAILNLVQLHRPTSAFSAQGINRTLAGAVETAYQTQSRLTLAECTSTVQSAVDDDFSMEPQSDDSRAARLSSNPLDDEVSILNVTTKSFGAGERGWVGRTVKLRTIAERWCVIQDMSAAAV